MWAGAPQEQIRTHQPNRLREHPMHTLITADVARTVVADRLRTAEDHRLARSFRRNGEETAPVARVRRRRFARLRRVLVATAN